MLIIEEVVVFHLISNAKCYIYHESNPYAVLLDVLSLI